MNASALTPWTRAAKRIPPRIMRAARAKIAREYTLLSLRVGHAKAREMVSRALSSLTPPLPGEPMEGLAPMAALAQLLEEA